MTKQKKQALVWTLVIVAVLAAFVTFLVTEAKKPGKYDAFAQCINDSGATFYGAWWCPHCQAQKAMFGKSAKLLPYVECQTPDSKSTKECTDLGIESYPTWEYPDGTRETGQRDFAYLAEKTSCAAPTQ
jgi:hypothetical protein